MPELSKTGKKYALIGGNQLNKILFNNALKTPQGMIASRIAKVTGINLEKTRQNIFNVATMFHDGKKSKRNKRKSKRTKRKSKRTKRKSRS